LNNGKTSSFASLIGIPISTDTDKTESIALADIDGDGDIDAVAGNWGQANRLYLNNGTTDPFAGVTGINISDHADETDSITLADVDDDGDIDVIVGNGTQVGQVNRLYVNNGNTNPFAHITAIDIPDDVHSTRSIALEDVDLDGDIDIVAGNWGHANRFYLNDGSTDPLSFTGINVSDNANNTESIALTDVDGDGHIDVVSGNRDQVNRLYLNDGSTDPLSFTGNYISSDTHSTWSIASGDVNGDGHIDIVAGNWNQVNRLYLNDGNTDPFTAAGLPISGDTYTTRSIALADINGDGRIDVITGNWNIQPNLLYLNDGDTDPFSAAGLPISGDAHSTFSIAMADVNSDGHIDVVAGNTGGNPNRLYLNNGSNNPFDGVSGKDISDDLDHTQSIALVDINGDGHKDVITGNSGQVNRFYLNNGTNDPFAGVTGMNISDDTDETSSIALADIEGDGDMDIVAGNVRIWDGSTYIGGKNRLYLNAFEQTTDGFQTHLGTITSSIIDNRQEEILSAKLSAFSVRPPDTWIAYYLSNNGGQNWYQVSSGLHFVFPTTGSDLRWQAELHSLSPAVTPILTSVSVTANSAPNDISLSNVTVSEKQATNTLIGIFTSSDLDGGAHTYSLVSGGGDTGNGSFVINGSALETAVEFDFETQNSYVIRVRTTDDAGGSFERRFTIVITDEPDPPTAIVLIPDAQDCEQNPHPCILENRDAGWLIGILRVPKIPDDPMNADEDANSPHVFSLQEGITDNALFRIKDDQLQSNEIFDFESNGDAALTYTITVRVSDFDYTYDQTFNIEVIDVSDSTSINVDPLTESQLTFGEALTVKANVTSDASGTLKTADAIFRFSGFVPFTFTDINAPDILVSKLKGDTDADNPALQYIRAKLSAATQTKLDAYTSNPDQPPPDTLLIAIIDELNLLLDDANLFTLDRFTETGLLEDTLAVIGPNPQGGDERRARNRLLLEYTFLNEISGIKFINSAIVGGDPVDVKYAPPFTGKWQVIIDWAGTADYDPGQSLPVPFDVGKSNTFLELFYLGVPQIKGQSREIPGRLNLANRNPGKLDISEMSITATITIPAKGETPKRIFTTDPATTDARGNFSITIPQSTFDVEGTYKITANFPGNDNMNSSDFGKETDKEETILVRSTQGYAILVQGAYASGEGVKEHGNTIDFVRRSFEGADFSTDPADPDIRLIPHTTPDAKELLRTSIVEWAKTKMINAPAPLYIVLINRGEFDKFHMHPDILEPADLDLWLDTLQDFLAEEAWKTENIAIDQQIITILGMCQSGSFISKLSPLTTNQYTDTALTNTRIVISAAAPDEFSIRGPGEADERQGEQFVFLLFQELNQGQSLAKSYTNASGTIRRLSANRTLAVNEPKFPNPSFPNEKGQHPLMDDNGDGIASSILNGTADGTLADKIFLAQPTNAVIALPIARVSPSVFLDANDDISSFLTEPKGMMWAEVDLEPEEIKRIWAEVKKVNISVEDDKVDSGSSMQHALDLFSEPMDFYAAGPSGEFTGFKWPWSWDILDPNPQNLFYEFGAWQVFFFAESTDPFTGISSPSEIMVYRASGGYSPEEFNLLLPEDNGTVDYVPTTLDSSGIFKWERSQSNGGSVQYVYRLWNDSVRNILVHESTPLIRTHYYLSPEIVQDNTEYWWDVVAVDAKGNAISSNTLFTFTIDFTNNMPGILFGIVTDKSSGNIITNGHITINSNDYPLDEDGYYIASLSSGSYTVTAHAVNYISSTQVTATVNSAAAENLPFELESNAQRFSLEINDINGYCNSEGIGNYVEGSKVGWSVSSPCPSSSGENGVRFIADQDNGQIKNIHADTTISVNWTRETKLTVNAGANGSVNVSETDVWFQETETVEITAVPDENYQLDHWEGDVPAGNENQNPLTVAMSIPRNLTAVFSLVSHDIYVTAVNGTVTGDGSYPSYTHGTAATLTAIPENGYFFTGWSGDIVDTANPLQMIVNADINLTASFSALVHQLTIDSLYGNPQGAGQHNHGVDVLWSITTPADGTVVGERFITDSASGSVLMDSDKTIEIVWTQQFELTIATDSGGSVNTPGGWYNAGSNVIITAIPLANYKFVRWEGDISVNDEEVNPLSVMVDQSRDITAVFALEAHIITAASTSNGSITGTGTFDHGAVTTLTAIPNANYHFINWSGDISGSINPLEINVTSDMGIQANFTIDTHRLTINSTNGNPVGEGLYTFGDTTSWSISEYWPNEKGENGIRFKSDQTGGNVTMDVDKTVIVNWTKQVYLAVNSTRGNPQGEGWYNEGADAVWSVSSPVEEIAGQKRYVTNSVGNTIVGVSIPQTVPVDWRLEWYVDLTAGENGIVTDITGWYNDGSVATLNADPNSGYSFAGWSGTGISNVIDPAASTTGFVVSEYSDLVASFALVELHVELEESNIFIFEGETAEIRFRLSAKPASNVSAIVIRIEGDKDITAGTASINIPANDWAMWRSVSLLAVEDDDAENGTALFRIGASGVNTITPAEVTVKEADNDVQQLIISTTIALKAGWNNVGYILREPVEIRTALSSLIDEANPSNSNLEKVVGENKNFYPNLDDSLNTLNQLNPGLGYWIKVKTDVPEFRYSDQ